MPTPITIDGLPTLTINGLATYSGSFDGTNDIIPVYENATTSTVGVSRNTMLGLSSAPVGLTDSQTLTNKILTSPTISSPTLSGTVTGTYTIGGTPTFPASVVTLTGSQTLTNKVLTSPTINTATISNPTLTVDTVSGYTTSNNGTVYGIGITGGQISSALTMTSLLTASGGLSVAGTLTLPNASVKPSALATGAAAAFVSTTESSSATSYGELTTTTDQVTVTIGANGLAMIFLSAAITNSSSGTVAYMSVAVSGATTQAANDNMAIGFLPSSGTQVNPESGAFLITGLTPGSNTFKAVYRVPSGTGSWGNRRIAVVPL